MLPAEHCAAARHFQSRRLKRVHTGSLRYERYYGGRMVRLLPGQIHDTGVNSEVINFSPFLASLFDVGSQRRFSTSRLDIMLHRLWPGEGGGGLQSPTE